LGNGGGWVACCLPHGLLLIDPGNSMIGYGFAMNLGSSTRQFGMVIEITDKWLRLGGKSSPEQTMEVKFGGYPSLL